MPMRNCRPARSIRISITSGRPIRMGLSVVSSSMAWAVRRTRSSSPSAKTMRRSAVDAASNTGRISIADLNTDPSSWRL